MQDEEGGKPKKESQSAKERKFLGRTETISIILATVIAGVGGWATYKHTENEDARKAREEHGFGACELQPQQRAGIARLQAHVQAGIHYTNLKNYDLAARNFQQVLDVDKFYLGANQNLGIVEMAKGDLNRAQSSFDAELKAINCLASVPESDRNRFAYSIGQLGSTTASVGEMDKWLAHAEARVHYNMACAYIKQNNHEAAKAELENAAKFHSIRQSNVDQDHDLDPIRHDAGFKSVLSSFSE